jgi:hypothetical protein
MLLKSILITAVVISCLALQQTFATVAEINDQILPKGISLPFNDLLPPLLDAVGETSTAAPKTSSTTSIPATNPTPAKTTKTPKVSISTTATPTTMRTTAQSSLLYDKQSIKDDKLSETVDNQQQQQQQQEIQDNANFLELPFNDLLPPFLDNDSSMNIEKLTIAPKQFKELKNNKKETKLETKAVIKPVEIIQKSNTNQLRQKKPEVPQKRYKKPVLPAYNTKQKATVLVRLPSSTPASVQLSPETIQYYLQHYYHTTRKPKLGLPTLTPFPRHLK